NCLESYAYSLRNTLQEEKVASQLAPTDKDKINTAIKEVTDWLDNSQEASKEEYESRQKELEDTVNPIMTKLYQAGGAAGAPGTTPDTNGPTVEEVD
ncbi:heat shock protein 70kD, C-terminal subdomain-containing protein, partial [Backusella circina FSU 941]